MWKGRAEQLKMGKEETAGGGKEKQEINQDGNEEKIAADQKESEEKMKAKAEFQSVLALRKELTDVGQFSYAGLCAVCLYRLFSNDWDKEFQKETVSRIIKHLDQTEQVKTSLMAIMNGQGDDSPDPYLSVLQKERALQDRRSLLIEDLITVALLNGDYDSRMRTLIKYMAWQIHVSWDDMEKFEEALVEMLKEEEHVQTDEEIAEKKKRETRSKIKRYALIGLATVGGGTIIGLTGGLAAPLIAAGAGAVIGGAGAAALGSVAGVAIIGSLFGAAGAGLGAYKMKRRLGGLEEFEFEPLTEGNHLDITIAITGWLTEENRACQGNASNKQKFVQKSAVKKNTLIDFRTPWMNLANSREQYCLRYESHYLEEMGKSMDYLMSFFMTAAAQEAIKYTILSGILAAVAWPATLLSAASVIDNPWSVCAERSATTGKHLAEVLLSRLQGKRPVTLIGFSLGARVIYYCLEEMSKRKNCEGIVEEAVMLGAPVPGDPKVWSKFTRVVAGRIINGYCRGDWLLKFLYRTASVQFSIAGLGPVRLTDRRMHNVDLTDIVSGHTDYSKKIDDILRCVGIRTVGPVVVAMEATDLDKNEFEIVDYPPPEGTTTEMREGKVSNPDGSNTQNGGSLVSEDSEQQKNSAALTSDEICVKFKEIISPETKSEPSDAKDEPETVNSKTEPEDVQIGINGTKTDLCDNVEPSDIKHELADIKPELSDVKPEPADIETESNLIKAEDVCQDNCEQIEGNKEFLSEDSSLKENDSSLTRDSDDLLLKFEEIVNESAVGQQTHMTAVNPADHQITSLSSEVKITGPGSQSDFVEGATNSEQESFHPGTLETDETVPRTADGSMQCTVNSG